MVSGCRMDCTQACQTALDRAVVWSLSNRLLCAVLAGNKVEQWFRTPFDIAAFGPRATLGALLSMPERLQTL
jgi:hypothetical protein